MKVYETPAFVEGGIGVGLSLALPTLKHMAH